MKKKDHTIPFPYLSEPSLSRGRLWLLGMGMAAVTAVYLVVLADAQVLHHKDYLAQSTHSILRTETVKASRGIITDRNGTPLITNTVTYDLTFDPALLSGDQEPNTELLRLLRRLTSEGRGWDDGLPVSWTEPFSFTVDRVPREEKRRFLNYLISLPASRNQLGNYLLLHRDMVDTSDWEAEQAALAAEREQTPDTWREKLKSILRGGSSGNTAPALTGRQLLERLNPEQLTASLLADAGITTDLFLGWMRAEMEVPESFTDMEARTVLGVQYELKQRRLGDNSVYLLTENVDTPFLSILADGDYSGYRVVTSTVRQYETDAAAHILGTVGSLQKEDLEDEFYQNYPLDAVVGRSGTESAFERYLHGTDGRRVLSVSDDGKITGSYYSKVPQPGSNVELTLDLPFQKTCEQALQEIVEELNASLPVPKRGAGVAVVKIGTGEILALASYPTFKLSEYRTNFNDLLKDPADPLVNRATAGLYAPGSTLKPATAFAALDSGACTLRTTLYDSGYWQYPGTHVGTYCWVRTGHGSENVTTAITDSCNYFFAEMGFRMGMDTLNSYLVQFGLGEHTGIETGDSAGNRPYNPAGEDQSPWAAYGQSNQRYTPLQLANYIATLASGGKHCEAHLLKAVKSYDNTETIAEGHTEALNTVEINSAYLNAIRTGMHNLVHGSLWSRFSECVVDAGAKTGTAQVVLGDKSNGVFICFAPYENPEVAIGMVIEKSDSGAALASTAVKILNAWFDRQSAASTVTAENTLLP